MAKNIYLPQLAEDPDEHSVAYLETVLEVLVAQEAEIQQADPNFDDEQRERLEVARNLIITIDETLASKEFDRNKALARLFVCACDAPGISDKAHLEQLRYYDEVATDFTE